MSCTARILTVLAACAALVAQAASTAERSFERIVVRGKVSAAQHVLRVEKDDAVRLIVTSDMPGEIHLHGYRLQAQLAPGTPAVIAFKAHATGRYPLEWHGAGAAAAAGAHRAPPLATLEVRPK